MKAKLKFLLIVSSALFLLTGQLHAAKIYKWRGPDGQIHYSSTPPPDADAQTIGRNTTKKTPETGEQAKDAEDAEVDLQGLSDEEKIRALENKLNREKIKQLEAQLKALEEGKSEKPESGSDAGSASDSSAAKGKDDEVVMPEEERKPDYSVQGQIRMLERTKQIEKMKTRCRAKAPHGVNCNDPASYEKY